MATFLQLIAENSPDAEYIECLEFKVISLLAESICKWPVLDVWINSISVPILKATDELTGIIILCEPHLLYVPASVSAKVVFEVLVNIGLEPINLV